MPIFLIPPPPKKKKERKKDWLRFPGFHGAMEKIEVFCSFKTPVFLESQDTTSWRLLLIPSWEQRGFWRCGTSVSADRGGKCVLSREEWGRSSKRLTLPQRLVEVTRARWAQFISVPLTLCGLLEFCWRTPGLPLSELGTVKQGFQGQTLRDTGT